MKNTLIVIASLLMLSGLCGCGHRCGITDTDSVRLYPVKNSTIYDYCIVYTNHVVLVKEIP